MEEEEEEDEEEVEEEEENHLTLHRRLFVSTSENQLL